MQEQELNPQYRRLERDWDELLFKANGASLTLYVTVITGLIASDALSARLWALIPCMIYFIGLCFAFVVHISHRAIDEDVRQRERLNDARTFIIDKLKRDDLPPTIRTELEVAFGRAEEKHKTLMTIADKERTDRLGGKAYFWSLGCFLASTFLVMIYFGIFLVNHA